MHNTFGESHVYLLEIGVGEDAVKPSGSVTRLSFSSFREHLFQISVAIVHTDLTTNGQSLEHSTYHLSTIDQATTEPL